MPIRWAPTPGLRACDPRMPCQEWAPGARGAQRLAVALLLMLLCPAKNLRPRVWVQCPCTHIWIYDEFADLRLFACRPGAVSLQQAPPLGCHRCSTDHALLVLAAVQN